MLSCSPTSFSVRAPAFMDIEIYREKVRAAHPKAFDLHMSVARDLQPFVIRPRAHLAHARGLPLLVIHHQRVARGIFDRGAVSSFIYEKDLSNASWPLGQDIQATVLDTELIEGDGRVPLSTVADHGVEDGEQLSHACDHGDLGRLSFGP